MCNTLLAAGIIVYAVREMNVSPGPGAVALYVYMILIGLLIHYATVVMLVSLSGGAIYIARLRTSSTGPSPACDVAL